MNRLFQKGPAWGWAGLVCMLCVAAGNARAAEWYVKTNGNNSAAGTNWATAKLTIQAAIDAAISNDTVWVSNGVYATGGRAVFGAMNNRVVIDKPITVKSVNGPAATIIKGAWHPGTTNGNAAVRCVYVGTNAVLSGFTLTNGATRIDGNLTREGSGGGAWCETSGVVSNCALTGNSASVGGGGSYNGTLNNCILSGNSSDVSGGGSYNGTLNSCTFIGNSSSFSGGGANNGKLYGCILVGNSAGVHGGGAASSKLNNCTLTGNAAGEHGGGAAYGTLTNCIVYYNTAPGGANHLVCTFSYSCTMPRPAGTGNTTQEPGLASASRLALDSPCIGEGSSVLASGSDIDGEAWRDPPSMGCDEVVAGSITGALSVGAWAAYTNVAIGFPVQFRADVSGRPTASAWQWGDGSVASNQPYAAHAFSDAGVYPVVLIAYNESYPSGVATTVTVQVAEQMVQYVDIGNATPDPPFSSWETAATNIQDAIDAASQVGGLILVSNGVYAAGGRVVHGAMTNRVAIDKPVTVRSVNGPESAIIRGAWDPVTSNGPGNAAVRCVYVGTNAALSGFTLTNGATRISGDNSCERSGGGGWCEPSGILSNCIVTGNAAIYDAGGSYRGMLYDCIIKGNTAAGRNGGGVCAGTLNRCFLTENVASGWGGGVRDSTLDSCALFGNTAGVDGGGSSFGSLNHCTLVGNTSFQSGGGTHRDTLMNCIVYYNASPSGENYAESTFIHSCTTPDPGGTENITNEPMLASAVHLAAGSPCAGAGSSAFASGTDIDGDTWLDPPSLGCDEVAAGSITGDLSVAIWAAYTNFSTDFSAPFRADVVGRTTGSEWRWGDGTGSSNQPCAWHTFPSGGIYEVTVMAYNETYPLGVAATVTVQAIAPIPHYVKASNATPVPPYSSWATAATNIQDAIDAVPQGGSDLVLVSNGVYATGGRVVHGAMTNRVVIDKPVTVQSVNGPGVTAIRGAKPNGNSAVRCVYLVTNALLSGFTLTNGATRTLGDLYRENSGGGAYGGGTLSNCVLWNNVASDYGGGADECMLIDCTLTGNSSGIAGGGSSGGMLSNCTFTGNSSASGGGTDGGMLNNCTLIGNSAGSGGGTMGATLNNCLVAGNSASSSGGGAWFGVLDGCTLSNNSAFAGGGANYCTLSNCLVVGNSATNGGGTYESTLYDSMLRDNRAGGSGGGAGGSTLVRCNVTGNFAPLGGGTYGGMANMCWLTENAADVGGGARGGQLNNCVLSGNESYANGGGGADNSLLNNCTLTGNTAYESGGGAYGGTLNNCIAYYNSAKFGTNYWGAACNYSCTTPAPGGTGNITNNPRFVNSAAGDYRLRTNSPCINRGNNDLVQGETDLDGNPRIAYGTVDMGAYEAQFPAGYWAWASEITNGLTNDTDCAAGDGMPNLLKYAAGGSPMAADGLARLDLAFENGAPTLLFNRNPNATDVTLVIQGADEMSDAAEWRGLATNLNGSWGGAANVSESGQGNPVACAVADVVPLQTNRFLRLKVTRP